MNIELFYKSLSEEEKQELFRISLNWKFPKVEKTEIENKSFTDIIQWINSKPQMSVRLKNNLLGTYNPKNEITLPFRFLEEVNEYDFLKGRNAGKKGWLEFVGLRGW